MSSKKLLSDEELAAIAQFHDSPLFNEREKLVMRYAEEMCQTAVNVPDALFDQHEPELEYHAVPLSESRRRCRPHFGGPTGPRERARRIRQVPQDAGL